MDASRIHWCHACRVGFPQRRRRAGMVPNRSEIDGTGRQHFHQRFSQLAGLESYFVPPGHSRATASCHGGLGHERVRVRSLLPRGQTPVPPEYDDYSDVRMWISTQLAAINPPEAIWKILIASA